jgi:hypothetical protein
MFSQPFGAVMLVVVMNSTSKIWLYLGSGCGKIIREQHLSKYIGEVAHVF